jgi:hypothetical protein
MTNAMQAAAQDTTLRLCPECTYRMRRTRSLRRVNYPIAKVELAGQGEVSILLPSGPA